MRLPNSYSKYMPGDENNNEIIKGQRYMFYDYRLTFLLQILLLHYELIFYQFKL